MDKTLQDVMAYFLLRGLLIGGAVMLVVLGLFAVALVLRRLGKLDRARQVVEPIIREGARRRGGLANMVVERVIKERR
jgi:Flp pilus assembly protein protease CpaA